MPFAKWNLEPVYVSRTLPWASAVAAAAAAASATTTNSNGQNSHHHDQIKRKAKSSAVPPVLPAIPNFKTPKNTRTKVKVNSESFRGNDHVNDCEKHHDESMMNGHSHESNGNSHLSDDEDDIMAQNDDQQLTTPMIIESMNGGSGNDMTDDEQVLLKIHNRTLVGIIQQMASLLYTADQLFAEMTDECRKMFDRSVRIRSRFNKLIIDIDHLNHKMRHSVPTIGHISDYCNQFQQQQQQQQQMDPIVMIGNVPHQLKCLNQVIYLKSAQNQQHSSLSGHHWKSSRSLDRSLFTIDSRPVSIRDLYARAHAPGDVRLSCSIFSPFIQSSPWLNVNQHQQHRPITLLSSENMTKIDIDRKKKQSQCQCHCGQCHTLPASNTGDNLGVDSSMVESSSSREHNHNTQCEYCHHTTGIVSNESNSSTSSASSSSVVTWSSVTSSTFEPIASASHCQHRSEQKSLIRSSKAKVTPMSSFLSSGDYYPNNDDDTSKSNHSQPIAAATKTIDDFFRKNNVNLHENGQESRTRCICSCDQSDQQSTSIMELSRQASSNATINQSVSMATAAAMAMGTPAAATTLPDYWYWRWLMESNYTGVPNASHRMTDGASNSNFNRNGSGHYNHKRWSSALTGSSPLKPTLLDEMTIWLRENIETRRPESIVIKSASELPEHVLLERALSPPCSSHSITLRRHHSKSSIINDEQDDENEKQLPKLKRRWSLLPLRRLSKRWRMVNDNNRTNRLSLAIDGSLSDNERIERKKLLLRSQSSHEHNDRDIHTSVPSDNNDEDDDPKEIILMSPEERDQLLAKQFSDPQTVSIDVSGRSFDRLSNTRRSLIHSEFHVPRNKIPGYHSQRRSRSKSPHVSSRHTNNTMVSPYALGHCTDPSNIYKNQAQQTPLQSGTRKIIAIEKGCQTDNNLLVIMDAALRNSKTNNNRFVVPIEVHRNHNDLIITDHQPHKEARRQPYNDDDADDDIDDYDDYDDDEDDEYVVIRKRYHQTSNHRKARIDDTTSSNASMELGISWRNRVSLMKPMVPGNCSIATQSASIIDQANHGIHEQQNHPSISVQTANTTPMTTSTTSTTVTAIIENNEMKKDSGTASSKQNGARSSSGNWSAATSDLIPSSSSSSSPPLNVPLVSKNENKNQQQQRRNLRTQHLDPTTTAVTNNNAEEAESVYSVDNDGYYTSMHTDSGLFMLGNYCNQALPLSTVNAKTKTSTFTSQTSLAKRQQHLQQQQQRRLLDSTESYRFNLALPLQQQHRWKRLNATMANHQTQQSAVSPTTNKKDIKLANIKHNDEEEKNTDIKKNLRANETSNSLRRSSQEEFGSNLSINSILSNSDACDTSTAAMDHVSFGTCNSSMVDFDCSVSHCSHQQQQSHCSKQQQGSRSYGTNGGYIRNSQSGRLRTASGTYQEDETGTTTCTGTIRSSSSSETLHTNDYEEEPMHDDMRTNDRSHIQKPHRNYHSLSAVKINHPSTSTVTTAGTVNISKHKKIQRYTSLTESSSASSSCRKLPPPPPPPRVSSMLRTLQKYNTKRTTNKRLSTDAADGCNQTTNRNSSSTTNDHQIVSQRTSDTSGNQSHDVSIGSESNSEYLLQSIHDERRRRLFLDVDTNRSYPPLSYIVYDQLTDTATSVSIPSSVCFDDEPGKDEQESGSTDQASNEENDQISKQNKTFKTSDAMSNRTITPVADQDQDNEDIQSQQHPQATKKQLEHRHLSSPLPPPKLDSFKLNHNNSSHRQNRHHRSYQSRYQSTSPSTTRKIQDSNQLSSTSSLTSSSTIKAPSSPETIPKPKPRNSLILCSINTTSTSTATTPPSSVMSSITFSTSTCSSTGGAFSSPDSTNTTVTAINARSAKDEDHQYQQDTDTKQSDSITPTKLLHRPCH
ncbi:hypothetical protein HUG17_0401 [Dermatophagoides farinae]|uniref:WASP family protein member n=1 Tax=Dermatophagoides farinae TaxID=6954 RepID=A0A9D4P6N5_DERFA|nr:serine-rich adhesin for platelets-like [Dermatophagoides farinae]KAH7644863.1 hypothetical protein HUG17_0401 [Dermatophagoides farinae]